MTHRPRHAPRSPREPATNADPRPTSKGVRAGELLRLGAVLLFFAAAPTAGDIGSCGQDIEDLNATKFFTAKDGVDCGQCNECGIQSASCRRACDPEVLTAFPAGCYPLVHDGEVCLDALEVAGCVEYAQFMSDASPTVPTECNFCPPLEGAP